VPSPSNGAEADGMREKKGDPSENAVCNRAYSCFCLASLI